MSLRSRLLLRGCPRGGKDFETILKGYQGIYFADSAEIGGCPDGRAASSVLYRNSLEWLFSGRQKDLFSKYVFDISPATDDKPYYSGYLKLETVPAFLSHVGDISEEWGYLLLLGTFLQSLLFAALIMLLPLATRWRELFRGQRGTAGVILYYACLGLGYMMAEMFLIQKFVFFLADPVYANALVITILLISSGIGSLLSTRLRFTRRLVVLGSVCGIILFLVFSLFGLSPVLRSALGLPLPAKAVIAAILIAPFGLCLGVPFPTGLSTLSENRRAIMPWAWGVNGALSVTGSVLTRLISTSVGFVVVLGAVGTLYAIAALSYQANERGQV